MSYAGQLLELHPPEVKTDLVLLTTAIEALSDCAQACTADTAADLSEPSVTDMAECIRLCLDCTDICTAAVAILSRRKGSDTGSARGLMEACASVCKVCGDECERHAKRHEHCRVCAEACRRCEHACRELLRA